MKRIKPKHNEQWDFVRKTFRQACLVRSFVTVSNRNGANINVEIAAIRILEDARRRRHLFFKKIFVEESFIGRTLGIDRSGMCIRHPNQHICKSSQLEWRTEYHEKISPVVSSCQICRSQANQESSNHSRRNRPAMVNAMGEIQELQSDKNEWKKRSGTRHSNYGKQSNIDSSMEQNEEPMSSDIDSNVTFESDNFLTQDEWVKFARFRILQVRSWEDRFALKNNPIFCHYFKMLEFGVSLDAAKFAVETDGYDSSIMDLTPNLPLELQVDQLGPDALKNLRSKGVLTKESEKEEISSEDDSDLDCADSSAEVNIDDTLRRFLSVIRRRRSNHIFAILAMLDENEHIRQQEKNKSHDRSSNSDYRQHQHQKYESKMSRNLSQTGASDVPRSSSLVSVQKVVAQHVFEDSKSSQKRSSKILHRTGREHGHSQRTSRTTNKLGREHRQSKTSSEVSDKMDREHLESRGTAGMSDDKHQCSERTSRTTNKIGRRESKRSIETSDIMDCEHRERHGATEISDNRNQRGQITSRIRNKGGSEHCESKRSTETPDKMDREHRGSYAIGKSSRISDTTSRKHLHNARSSRTIHKLGHEHRESQRRTETLDKMGHDHLGSPRKFRTTDASGRENHFNQRISTTMIASSSKRGNSQSTSRPLDRSDQKQEKSQTTFKLLNKSGHKHQNDRKGTEIPSNIQRDSAPSSNKKSTPETTGSRRISSISPKPIGGGGKQTNNATTPTIEDGDNRTKRITWNNSVIQKHEGPPSKRSLFSTGKEKEQRIQVMKSGNKTFIEKAKEMMRRPVRNHRSPLMTIRRNEAKSQDNEDRPDDSEEFYQILRSNSRMNRDPKDLRFSDPSFSPPIEEVLYSDPPRSISPLNNESPSRQFLRWKEKSNEEKKTKASVKKDAVEIYYDRPMNNESPSKQFLKWKEKSNEEKSTKASAKKGAVEIYYDRFDVKSSNTKGNAATSHREPQYNHLEDFKNPKSHAKKNVQKAGFVENKKLHDLRKDLRSRENEINGLLRNELKRKDSVIDGLRLQIKKLNEDTERRRGMSYVPKKHTSEAKHNSIDNQKSMDIKKCHQNAEKLRVNKGYSISDSKRQQDGYYSHRGGLVSDLNSARSNRRRKDGDLSKKSNSFIRRHSSRASRKKSNQCDVNEGSNYEQILLDCIQRLHNIEDEEMDEDSYEFQWNA